MAAAGTCIFAWQLHLRIDTGGIIRRAGLAGYFKLQPAVLADGILDSAFYHLAVKALHPFLGKEIRAIDNPVALISMADIQWFDPHFKTVARNALFDGRFYLFPYWFHKVKRPKSFKSLKDKVKGLLNCRLILTTEVKRLGRFMFDYTLTRRKLVPVYGIKRKVSNPENGILK